MYYLRNVVSLELDEDKCNGCGICLKVCPHAVFSRNGKDVRIVNRDACMECGACAMNCEPGAMRVQSGVGCAAAVLNAKFSKNPEICCGPSDTGCGSGCC